MAQPLSRGTPKLITVNTTVTVLTGDTSSSLHLTVQKSTADFFITFDTAAVDGAAPTAADPYPVELVNLPDPIPIHRHGLVGVYTLAGTADCTLILS